MRIAILILGLTACGSESPAPVRPSTCDPAARSGTYLTESTLLSGDCGPLASALVRMDGTGAPSNCQLKATDSWSEGNCRLDRSISCPNSGGFVITTGFTTQQDEAGSLITGKLTFEIHDAAERLVCVGTYDVKYTRQ